MPVDINTWNNLHAQGLRASRALQQAQVLRALQLLGSRDQRQRAWASQALRSLPVRQALQQFQQLVYNFGQTIAQMKREQATATPAQTAEDLANLANLFDDQGLHATADLADHVAGKMVKEAGGNFGAFWKEMHKFRWELMKATQMLDTNTDPIAKHVRALVMSMSKMMNKYESASKCASREERLVALASNLDARGDHGLADAVDMVMKSALFGGRKQKKEPPAPVKPGRLTPLSTRHCPDHRGVSVARVAENTYQCPIDGRTYNYEAGYVDYQGQAVPGGSIAGQTPDATPVAIPHRIFDTRENVLNALN